MQIVQLPCREDNYAILIHDKKSNQTILFDAPEHDAIADYLTANNWQLTAILLTHYHFDHIAGVQSLKQQFGATVYGSKINSQPLDFLDHYLDESSALNLLGLDIKTFDTPGHKSDHICFYIQQLNMAVVADVLFSLGCGRVLDGTAQMLYSSIQKISQLPDDTILYCGHEYTTANAKFAQNVEPDNLALNTRIDEITQLRQQNKPTLPTILSLEKATNPFLRTYSPEIRKNLGMPTATDEEVFVKLRSLKDNF